MLVRQLLTLPIHFLFAGWTWHHNLSFCLSMCRSFSFTLSPASSFSPSLSICLSVSLPVTVYLLVCFCACLPLSLPHPRLCSSLPPFVSLPPSVPPSLLSRLLSTFAASSCLGLPYKSQRQTASGTGDVRISVSDRSVNGLCLRAVVCARLEPVGYRLLQAPRSSRLFS